MFDEILVVDYITDVNDLSEAQLSSLSEKVNGSNFLNDCPNGTVIGQRISDSKSTQPMVFYPFFSHIRTPVKAGERAWAFSTPGRGPSYWITRKVQDKYSEDPNFTFEGRSRVGPGLKDTQKNRENLSSNFQDTLQTGVSISSVIKSAISRSEFVGEPVVGVKSKSTDFSLQGSNGAIIKIGNEGVEGSSTINLAAGMATTNSLSTVQNNSSFTGKSYKEIIKPLIGSDSSSESKSSAALAGTLSADDPSRVIISQKFSADSYYSLGGEDAGEVPTISLKTDCVRIIAENDLKIFAGSSSILIKNDGNIVITPGAQIKLSGESDDQAYLRYDEFNKIINSILEILGALQTGLTATNVYVDTLATAAGAPAPGQALDVEGIGNSASDILLSLESIKSQKILGS